MLAFGFGLLMKGIGVQVTELSRLIAKVEDLLSTDEEQDEIRMGTFRLASRGDRLQGTIPNELAKKFDGISDALGIPKDIVLQLAFICAILQSRRWVRRDWKQHLAGILKSFLKWVDSSRLVHARSVHRRVTERVGLLPKKEVPDVSLEDVFQETGRLAISAKREGNEAVSY